MIERFLNRQGLLKAWPAKYKDREMVRKYIVSQIDNREYTEKEITSVLDSLHSFDEAVFIRRDLIDYKYLLRDKEGRTYKVNSEKIFDLKELEENGN